jgi:hypothetical protein
MEFTVGDEVAKVAEAEAAGASTAEEAEQWNDLARRSAISTLRATVAPAIDVVHELFSKIGTPQTYEPDAVLIPESSAPGAPRAMYITNGLCSIRRGSKEVGNAGPGDLVGEMRMLLGDASNVAVVADTEVETIEVRTRRHVGRNCPIRIPPTVHSLSTPARYVRQSPVPFWPAGTS